MKIPVIRGVIDRRILVNYHVDPGVLAPLLPAPFRPKIIRGAGLVGICLIRFKQIRPAYVPSWLGLSSDNAAHRVAVEWDEGGTVHSGVYVRRRDTNSRLNSLAGGRVFPGFCHRATFTAEESNERFHIGIRSADGNTRVEVRCHLTDKLPPTSVFQSLEEASSFFQTGSLGYSATPVPGRFQGMELQCRKWHVEPLDVDEVRSSEYEDSTKYPIGSIGFDCALLMRGLEHEWHGRTDLCCGRSHMGADPESRLNRIERCWIEGRKERKTAVA